MKKLVFLFLTALAATLPPATFAATEVHSLTLKNGMQVFVKEDHRAPVVASMVWYKIGAAYEPQGLTGISHVLEHMMFKGTKKYPPGEFSRIIAANGGRENAFTSQDYTAYFQQLEKDRIEISFKLEADRMRHLIVQDKEFQKELKVVMEERRMRVEDSPTSLTYEHFAASAYLTSPYHNPVIGWMHDLEHLTSDDIRTWYKTWYAPNNAILVVVGDVDPKKIFKLAKTYFGPLEPSKIVPVKPQPEVPQKGERRITVRAPAELPYLIMGYKVPVVKADGKNWEPYALAVLAAILAGDNSARFAKHLVRGQQIAASADASYDPFALHDNLFLFDGNPAQGKSMAELEKAIQAQIKRVKEDLVSAKELERVKSQVIASKVYEQDSVFYQAMQIGALSAIGLDWRENDKFAEHIQQITAAQVRDVAQKYLTNDTLTTAILDPLPLDGKAPPRHVSGGHHH